MIIVNNKEDIYDLLKKDCMTLLYFSSPSCAVCDVVRNKLEITLKDFPKISAYEIPPYNNEEILAHFNIFTFPAILLYINGKEYLREARHFSVENLIQDITRYYELFNQK